MPSFPRFRQFSLRQNSTRLTLCAGGAALLAILLVSAGATAGEMYCPKAPFYPHHNYPSVLDAPRGYGPVPTYGFAGPSYRWGWFGAQYRPRVVHYTGYTGDYWQTGYRWGY